MVAQFEILTNMTLTIWFVYLTATRYKNDKSIISIFHDAVVPLLFLLCGLVKMNVIRYDRS